MNSLIPLLLTGLILPQAMPAKDGANPVDPKADANAVVIGTRKPASAQHHETDHKFLTQRARRNGAVNAMVADLKKIQMRAKTLNERLRAIEDTAGGTSASDHILLGRQVGAPGAEDAERRIPHTLKHKDRAVNEVDDRGPIKTRLSAVEKTAQSELTKLKTLDTEAGGESGQITFGDGVHGSGVPKTEYAHTDANDAALRAGQKTVNQLQSDLDALTTEIEDLERQNLASVRKKPGRLK